MSMSKDVGGEDLEGFRFGVWMVEGDANFWNTGGDKNIKITRILRIG